MITIDVPGLASNAVDWDVIPTVASDFPLDGLASYLAVQGATLNANSRVSDMSRWAGANQLAQPNLTSSPIIEAVGGYDMLRTVITAHERLIGPPAPAGGAWSMASSGMSLIFPVRMINTATSQQGFCNIGNVRMRYLTSGAQVQVGNSGVSVSAPFTWGGATKILGLTFDDAADRLRVYVNGSQVVENINSLWAVTPSSSPVYCNEFNSGSGAHPSEAYFGDLAVWGSELTAANMLIASRFVGARFGVTI